MSRVTLRRPPLRFRRRLRRLLLVLGFLLALVLYFRGHITVISKPPPPPPPPSLQPRSRLPRRPAEHHYRDDGIMDVHFDAPHPVYELISRAQTQWKAKHEKASRTLHDAVGEYTRRYGRAPPKGFDQWWTYVTEHHVQLPDEYDRIYHDIEPFWGVSPEELSKGQVEREKQVGSFTIVSKDGQVSVAYHDDNDLAASRINRYKLVHKANEQMDLLESVQAFLPDFRATFGAGDLPSQFTSNALRSAAVKAARRGEVINVTSGSRRMSGLADACPAASVLASKSGANPPPKLDVVWANSSRSFVYDHPKAMDPCRHPSYVYFNGLLQSTFSGTSSPLVPNFSLCTTSLHSDILAVPTAEWVDENQTGPTWQQKKHKKLHWRGSNVGLQLYSSKNPHWNMTHRVRFVEAMTAREGEVHVLPSSDGKYTAVGHADRVEKGWLNDDWMDVKFTGEPVQCESGVKGTCVELERRFEFLPRWEDEAQEKQWKYMIDIDGNGASSRFKKLTMSRSLVFKATIHPEWYTDRIQPWLHYVPVKYDYTDLYDLMTFFVGDIHKGSPGHDEMASSIGLQARKWSTSYWRKEDMTAYMFRLFLEYARVMSPDRDEMSFKL